MLEFESQIFTEEQLIEKGKQKIGTNWYINAYKSRAKELLNCTENSKN